MLNMLIGLITGIITSMGFGGGTILMIYLNVFKSENHLKSAGINYLYFLPCAAISVGYYIKSKLIKPKPTILLSVGAIAGAIAGALLSNGIDVSVVKKVFAVFIILTGFVELFK